MKIQDVIIEVRGGVAGVCDKPSGVTVTVIDYDEDEYGQSTCYGAECDIQDGQYREVDGKVVGER